MEPQPINKHLPATTAQLEVVPAGSTRLPASTKQLEIALRGEYLLNATDEKINGMIQTTMLKLGLIRPQQVPEPLETLLIRNHLRTYYGNHTETEFLLAFDLAINGTLGDVPHYGNFSVAYVTKVLNGYRKWAIPEYEQFIKNIPPPKPKRAFITDAELFFEAVENIQNCKVWPDFIVDILYRFAVGNGHLENVVRTPAQTRTDLIAYMESINFDEIVHGYFKEDIEGVRPFTAWLRLTSPREMITCFYRRLVHTGALPDITTIEKEEKQRYWNAARKLLPGATSEEKQKVAVGIYMAEILLQKKLTIDEQET